ncbi:prolipoprotein diacylglyceryl transferase, partial [Candidatus Peregrinibacteria bacterium]|nr:prolipoprotein diacylglyceryl transferase [Candidatus Peregrinibacteria bacterium]
MISLFPSRTVAIALFGFPIHWYGLLYLVGFLLAWWLLPRLQRYRGLALIREEWERLLGFAVLGVIVGGRLGFVLFY